VQFDVSAMKMACALFLRLMVYLWKWVLKTF